MVDPPQVLILSDQEPNIFIGESIWGNGTIIKYITDRFLPAATGK